MNPIICSVLINLILLFPKGYSADHPPLNAIKSLMEAGIVQDVKFVDIIEISSNTRQVISREK